MAKNYYQILGVDRTATVDAIKKAYRKLARKYHPDLNPNDAGAQKRFQEINEANEVLSDPVSRKKYDAFGEQWKHAEQFEKAKSAQGAGARSGHYGGGTYQDIDDDIFSQMFGGGRGRSVRFRGQDFQAELHLETAEAYQTHKRTLTVNGKQIRITVPAGVENDQTIKIPGHGGAGVNSGPAGDLFITFKIKPHPQFARVGKDLFANVELDLIIAVLGGEATVDTMDGKVKLKVLPGTQNGTKVRLKGKGFPIYKQEGRSGDLIVTYQVALPTQLSARERELFEELAALRKTTGS